ncbi:hypothetical protein GCM10022226_47030 [Sphaerisporangium flaviroseum]|uniref:Uncharacterized protein n=1 Tax=Sphaerisporangium flaviroseum TaxID=509199 RepID=A0ABP7ILC8_9ACTN
MTGGRSGWEARRRGGGLAWHLGAGVRGGGTHPATRKAAVTDLIADVRHAWTNLREQQALEAGDPVATDTAADF